MAETKEFKAESKRLLEMMINSIYTHKEIFLRELISNASDAMDKLYFKSMSENTGITRSDMAIKLEVNKDDRKLIITDNGIGMTREELENNLGTIAKSGSLAFKNENEKTDDVNIIGQFGVGFYSAFMVAKKVTVISKAYGSDTAYMWESEGVDGYTISEAQKDDHGTQIILDIKDNADEENYDEFLAPYKIKQLVKKYSDYIRYPIKMDVEHEKLKEGSKDEYEKEIVTETLNSMTPIWKKSKTSSPMRNTTSSTRTSSTTTTSRSRISTPAPRVLLPTPRCCIFPQRRPTTTTPRTSKRVCSCTPAA